MELSSPLLDGGVTNGNIIRYSVADSGVNMTSPDMDHGHKIDPHSKLPRNADQFRNYPYFITEIPVSDDPDSESSYYNTMIPFSVLGSDNKDGVEQNDMQLTGSEVDDESGVGMESQVSDSSTTRLCSTSSMEPRREGMKGNVVSKTGRMRMRTEKKWSGIERESICEVGEGELSEGVEEEEKCEERESGDESGHDEHFDI